MAVIAVKRSLQVCNRYRRKTSVIGSLTPGMKINYDNYTAGGQSDTTLGVDHS